YSFIIIQRFPLSLHDALPFLVVHGLFTMIFGLQSFIALWLCLIGLTALIPRLVTQDRASNALTIYLARPLTSADYLIGKLGIIVDRKSTRLNSSHVKNSYAVF